MLHLIFSQVLQFRVTSVCLYCPPFPGPVIPRQIRRTDIWPISPSLLPPPWHRTTVCIQRHGTSTHSSLVAENLDDKGAKLSSEINVLCSSLKVRGKYDVGVTAGIIAPSMLASNAFIAIELKKPGVFKAKSTQGLATAIAAALSSGLRVVTVYTDLANSWWLMWYIGGNSNKFAILKCCDRDQARTHLCQWISYNNEYVNGETDETMIEQTPPPPFQDIKRFSLRAAAEPQTLKRTDFDDDSFDRLRDVLDDHEMKQLLAEQVILNSLGPDAFRVDQEDLPFIPLSSISVC